MKLDMFTIRDAKAETFGVPFFFSTQGQALRAFMDLANDTQSTVNQHPEDYSLYYTGAFDQSTGDFTAFPQPKLIIHASDILSAKAVPLRKVD